MAHPYDNLPYAHRTESFRIQWELPTHNPFVFKGFYVDDENEENPVDAHVYYEDKEDEALYWCQFMVTHNYCDNFIGVHACVRMATPNGVPVIVLFTECSHYSLRYWLNLNPEQLVTVNYDSDYINFSSQLNRLLRSVLTSLVNLWTMNSRHGDLSLDTIFVVGDPGQERAKLGRFKGEPAIALDPDTEDYEQVKMNFDLVGFVNIIATLDYPPHPGTGKPLLPSGLISFINLLSGSPQTPNSTWIQFNIQSSPNHPMFLDDDEEKVKFWLIAYRKVDHLKENNGVLYGRLATSMTKRLQRHGISHINWEGNVLQSGHTESITCLNHRVTQYNMNNPFSFLTFARHLCQHYTSLNDHRADRYLYSYYPGYMFVVHEVLCGKGMNVFRNPY